MLKQGKLNESFGLFKMCLSRKRPNEISRLAFYSKMLVMAYESPHRVKKGFKKLIVKKITEFFFIHYRTDIF